MIINADEHDFVQCLKDKCTEGDEPHYKLLWDFYESSELSWTELMNIEDYWNFYDSWEEYVEHEISCNSQEDYKDFSGYRIERHLQENGCYYKVESNRLWIVTPTGN
jgi:hypothetical protein